jgi:hypothetical protein
MRVWNGWLDKKMRGIITATVDHFSEHNLTFDQVVEIMNCTFGFIFYCIRDPRMPTIFLKEGLGTFMPSPTKIIRKINNLLIRENVDVEKVSQLQKTYYRIRTEDNRRKQGKQCK